MLDLVDRLMAMEAATANSDADTLSEAADALLALGAAVRYADTRAVSRAAYAHASVEEKRLRDLIDVALAYLPPPSPA